MTITADGRRIEVSNPDKVLFPDAGITKLDLARYYEEIAPVMLPHITARPVTMHRFPDGIGEPGFYQKQVSGYFPDWVETVTVDKSNGEVDHVVCNDAATLVYLAGQACLTVHVWLSTTADPFRPDRMIFDLDPPDGAEDAGPVRAAARRVRDLLEELSAEPFLMTTGSTGYHVVVPLDPGAGFDEVRDIASRIAGVAVERHPELLTVAQRKSKRSGRVFVDYLRNAYAQTTVAPYAVRARPGAPAAVPIDWEELGSVDPGTYRMDNVFRRLGQKDDPWSEIGDAAASMKDIAARLQEM